MTLRIYTHTYIYISRTSNGTLFILQINIIFSLQQVVVFSEGLGAVGGRWAVSRHLFCGSPLSQDHDEEEWPDLVWRAPRCVISPACRHAGRSLRTFSVGFRWLVDRRWKLGEVWWTKVTHLSPCSP